MASQIAMALAMRPKRRRLRRPRPQRYPLQIERDYAAELRRVADQAIDAVNQRILPQLNRWAELAGARTDQIGDWTDELEFSFEEIRRDFARVNGELRQVAETVANRTSTFNRVQVGRQISAVVGGNLLPMTDDSDTIKGFINANVQAIKSIPEQYLGKVERIINDGYRSGKRAASLADAIAEVGGVTKRRANFIARDQIGSLNGQLTRRRQKALGVKEYIWRTSLDEGVRHSHAQLEGTRHSWDDPPTVGNRKVHPGEDYGCRCTAEPVIEGIEPEETSPADVPAPLPRRPRARAPAREAKRTRTPLSKARAVVEDPRRQRAQAIRDIPTSAEPTWATMPRTGKKKLLDAKQALRMEVSRVLDQSPATRDVATTAQRLERVLWNWVHGAKRKTSIETKLAAIREFQLRGVPYNPKNFRPAERDITRTGKDLRVLYNETQAYFAQRGIKTKRVFRGVKQAAGQRGAVESWTTKREIAEKFAGPNGQVSEQIVPVERILAIQDGPRWLDGIFGDQKEVIVLY